MNPRDPDLRRLSWLALSMALCFLAEPRLAGGQQQQQPLAPAVFNYKTDNQGFRWDVSTYGQISSGTNNAFSGAATLTVNRNSFRSTRRMMTADGAEYVLTGVVGNLEVTRRIKLDAQAGAVRYVEVLRNTGAAATPASIVLQTQLARGPAQAVVSSSGTPVAANLSSTDTGVIAVGNALNQQVSIVFHLAGADSKIKPTIRNQANQTFLFSFNLTVPPGKTLSIMHGLAQRKLNGVPTAKDASALFKPFLSRSWTRDLPSEIRRSIVNLDRQAFSDAGSLISLDALGIERQSSDILAVGDQTRLHGSASCERLELTTGYGTLEVALEKVAAIAGPRFTKGQARVFLADGQVYSGALRVEGLRFVLNSGLQFDVDGENLDRLLMRTRAEEETSAEGIASMLETAGGDRIALLRSDDPQLTVATPWGVRQIALDEVERMSLSEQKVGHHLLLRDGSRLFGFISGSALSLKTRYFGEQQFIPAQIHRLSAADSSSAEEEDKSLVAPHLLLAGENILVGQVDLAAIHFLTAGNKIPVPPNQIRVLRNVSQAADELSGEVMFEAELWDGGTVRGALAEMVLPVRSADRIAKVPLNDIVEVRVPTPVVTDTMRAKILQLVEELGHAEYEKRQAAKVALRELGHLPKMLLEETLRQTSDPEIRRSAETLLDELKE